METGDKKSPLILVADDDPTARALVASMLKQLGYTEVVKAVDGLHAWNLVMDGLQQEDPVSLVITDWAMPIADGMKLVDKIAHNSLTHELPVLVVTSFKDKDHVVKASKTQIEGYMIKPVEISVLKSKVEAALKAGSKTSRKRSKAA